LSQIDRVTAIAGYSRTAICVEQFKATIMTNPVTGN
jgi:hypothetical protein